MTKRAAYVNSELDQKINLILDQAKTELGFNQIAIGPLTTPLTIDFYEKWLVRNNYGDMNYLKEHLSFKKNPQLLNQNVTSVITVAQPYFPLQKPLSSPIPARSAMYAQNEDYHYWLKEKLHACIAILSKNFPDQTFLPYVDSGPILERNWAYQNGLGWFGKNTCLIHPKKGSLFFLAEILTSLPSSEPSTEIAPLPDFCGKCTKCIDVCPTSALEPDRHLVADRCISYLTIESKKIPDIQLRAKIADWFFGCDLCQTVCPWNQKVFKTEIQSSPTHKKSFAVSKILPLNESEKSELIDFFRFLLTSSNKKIQKHFIGTAFSRAGAKGLIRNALIVIANRKIFELKPEVESLITHKYLGELAQWVLNELTTN